MKKRVRFSGSEIAIIIVVLVIVGAVGWMAYTNMFAQKSDEASPDSGATNQQTTVEKESDLYKVDATLDDIKLEDTDSAELDNTLKTF